MKQDLYAAGTSPRLSKKTVFCGKVGLQRKKPQKATVWSDEKKIAIQSEWKG